MKEKIGAINERYNIIYPLAKKLCTIAIACATFTRGDFSIALFATVYLSCDGVPIAAMCIIKVQSVIKLLVQIVVLILT